MAVESIFYSVSRPELSGRGWCGMKASRRRGAAADGAQIGAASSSRRSKPASCWRHEGYVVFVADMFGEGNGPVGTENPTEFLRPFMSDVAGNAPAHRRRTRHASRGKAGPARRRRHIAGGRP